VEEYGIETIRLAEFAWSIFEPEKESKIFLKKPMTNLLTGEKIEGQVRLPKYDFLLLK